MSSPPEPDVGRPCRCGNVPADLAGYLRGRHCPRCTLWVFSPASVAAWAALARGGTSPAGGPGQLATALTTSGCRYEGAVVEYATCRCPGRHIRYCDHPAQGTAGVPDIDRCVREYHPLVNLQSCDRCEYMTPAGDSPDTAGFAAAARGSDPASPATPASDDGASPLAGPGFLRTTQDLVS